MSLFYTAVLLVLLNVLPWFVFISLFLCRYVPILLMQFIVIQCKTLFSTTLIKQGKQNCVLKWKKNTGSCCPAESSSYRCFAIVYLISLPTFCSPKIPWQSKKLWLLVSTLVHFHLQNVLSGLKAWSSFPPNHKHQLLVMPVYIAPFNVGHVAIPAFSKIHQRTGYTLLL